MAKDYPRASLRKSLEVAEAVYDLGGSCSLEVCAHKTGKKVSGGFRDIVASAGKFGLLANRRGDVATTALYKDIRFAYNEDQKLTLLQQSLLHVPLFREIYERFKGRKVPTEILGKILIKECAVNDQIAERVGGYFLESVKMAGLLGSDNVLKDVSLVVDEGILETAIGDGDASSLIKGAENVGPINNNITTSSSQDIITSTGNYQVHITGPGMNTVIVITEEEDLEIVEIVFKKIKRKLREVDPVN